MDIQIAGEQHGLDWCIIRPHNVYGPGMGFEHVVPEIIKKIFLASNKFKKKETSIVINGTGHETRSFCYIDDAVRSIILLAKKGSDKSIYNVGNNDETKILDIVKKISTILNIRVKIIKSKSPLGSAKRRNPDIKKILNLGYIKEFGLNEGLITTVKWYKNFFLNNR
jgi:nucleoside-diphosphate-sugar epimerase